MPSLPSNIKFTENQLLELSFDAIVVRDLDDCIEYWNRGAIETYGFSREEALGRVSHELLQTEFPTNLQEVQEQLLSQGRWIGELTHKRKDGSTAIVSSRWVLMRDRSGTPVATLESNRDITEQKKAENLIRENEQRLRLHTENTPLAVIEWGPDFRLSRWSTEAERIFGWRADEVLGKRMDEFRWIYEEDAGLVEETSIGLRDGTGSKSLSRNRNYRKDGSVVYCEWYNSSILDSSGNLVSIFSLVLDVTDQKRSEEALRASQQRFESIFKHAPNGIAIADQHGRFLQANPAYEQIVGYSERELREMSFTDLVWPEDLKNNVVLNESLHSGANGTFEVENRYRHKSGRVVWVHKRVSMIPESESVPGYIIALVTDVTERKKAEAALIRSEKLAAAGRVASTLAHEINNPLEAVVNLLYLIDRDNQLSAQTRGYLNTVSEEVYRASQMAKRTLSFYRAEFRDRPYSVSNVAEEVLRLYAPVLAGRGIEVRSSLDAQTEVTGASGEVRQLCTNLISNAIDAGTKRLEVRVSRCSDWKRDLRNAAVRITIADNGSGIPKELLKRVIEPFFTTKESTGTGLGLWVCQELLQARGGTLRVRSTVGKGSVFSAYLPTEAVEKRDA